MEPLPSKLEILNLGGSTNMAEHVITFITNNIGPNLLQLCRELQLNRTQITELEESNKSLQEKAHKMMDWWIEREGRQATPEALVKALRQIERNDMADRLTDAVPLHNEQEKLAIFSKLQHRLLKRYSHIPIPQPPNIKKDIPIDEIFVHQEMLMTDKESKEKPVIVHLEDLFQPVNDQSVTRILVEGNPGFGKTTLAFKLANDWAKKREYIASKFHLVMLIPLREVKEQKLEDVILGIIQRAVNRKSITTKELNSYISQYKVLLLLDGFDEMTVKSQSYLKDILEKEELECACILLTSRRGIFTNKDCFDPSMSFFMFQKEENLECEFWDKRIEMKGFTAEQRKKIVEDNFEINSDAINSMEKLFRGNAENIFCCPLFVFWWGWLMEKKPLEQIGTRTAFFKALVNLVLHKTLFRENQIKETISLDIFTPTHNEKVLMLKKQIQHLGKIALQWLIDQKLSFTEKDLNDLSGSILIVSDLFVKYKSITQSEEETFYQPMHKSFLEFLAAFSVSASIDNGEMSYEEFKATINKMISHGLGPSLNSLFIPFLAGLMGQRGHWLFDVLSPWSALYSVCQPEMINILVEITTSNDNIQSLVKFISSHYVILASADIYDHYFSSECHKKIFQLSVGRKLISVLKWDLSVLYPLPVKSLEVEKLYLLPSCMRICELPTATSIRCNELTWYIDKDVTPILWDFYLAVISNINAKHHHMYLCRINNTTCTMILNDILYRSYPSFQRGVLSSIPLEGIHLEILVQLIKNYRIRKGIVLNMYIERKEDEQEELSVSTVTVSQLWNAVVQSSFIDEFYFLNQDYQFQPVLDFSVPRKISFKMINLVGSFILELSDSTRCLESIHKLMLLNERCTNADVTNYLKNISHIDCFECNDSLFSSCVVNKLPFVSSLTELYLYIHEDVSLPSPSFTVEQMTSLQTLTVDTRRYSSVSIEQSVDNFLVAILNSRKLQLLAFNFIPSSHVFNGLMNIMSNVKPDFNLYCLELVFTETMFELSPSSLDPVKAFLRQKKLNHVAVVDWWNQSSVRSVLSFAFSEKEFLFKHEINGYEKKHTIQNRQFFENLFVTRNRYVIELKQEPRLSFSIT